LIERGRRVVLMTDERSGAHNSCVFAGREQHVLRGAGIAGRGVLRSAKALAALAAGTVQARQILHRIDAAAVIGFGGYPCVAPILAARALAPRPAILLHEQNAVLGRANRFLAKYADILALGFAATSRVPAGVGTQVTGNPVRQPIRDLACRAYIAPTETIALLVLGGSLGARIFSDVVPGAVALLPAPLRQRVRVTQQCRAEDLDRVRSAYEQAGITASLATFFRDVAGLMATAHFMIGRAGASTCAEIGVVGVPSILVPLPGAIDDHQAANAAALARAGGAFVMRQSDLNADVLCGMLLSALSDADGLVGMAQRAAGCGNPNAASALADLVEVCAARTEGVAR
jgi:UDP-N-acetylglucosamine--N-acetylmuramyl-(pentapeptide) pyrophosphoryl-undecaprenol N-acetylglucosamine transferase